MHRPVCQHRQHQRHVGGRAPRSRPWGRTVAAAGAAAGAGTGAAAAPGAAAQQRHQQQQQANVSEVLHQEAMQLKAWVEQFCAPWPAELQPVVRSTAGEHSMLAAGAVRRGQVLLQVPSKVFMTANTALASRHCGALVKKAELPEWQALVLHLLCERAAGADSFWAPYIAVLGDQRHHPLLWSSELQGQLTGSPMLRTIRDRLQLVQEDAALLVDAGANELQVAVSWQQQTRAPLVSPDTVAWAAAVLLGRSFQLDFAEPDMSLEADMSYFGSWNLAAGPAVLALVPWADMLRHSSEAGEGSMLVYDPEAGAALITSHRDYEPGAEVFDSHGPGLSHTDLVLDHGCVGEGTADNPRYDALLLAHVKPRGTRNAALLEALAGLTGGQPTLALTPAGPDITALALLRAALASDAELIKAGWRLGAKAGDVELAARVMGRLSQPLSAATEVVCARRLEALAAAALAAYPSRMNQDEAELAQLEQQQQQEASSSFDGCDEDEQQQRIRAGILRAIVSEKTALLGCQAVVLGWRQQLEALVAAAGGSAAAVRPEQLAAVYEGQLASDDQQDDD